VQSLIRQLMFYVLKADCNFINKFCFFEDNRPVLISLAGGAELM
jgi:hypothetical protein